MKKKKRFKIISILLIIICLFSGYKVAWTALGIWKGAKIKSETLKIKELWEENKNDSTVIEGDEKQSLDLRYINEDYKGWIEIENTNINYPIVQYSDNEYYLNRDINKEILYSGTIFLDYRNKFLEDKNTIIYGHMMKNNTMFGQLKKFKDEKFFNENKYIYITTLEGNIVTYEIFSLYVTDTYNDYLKVSFDDGEYKNYIATARENSIFNSDVEVTENDVILTLSTCSYEYSDARLVIHGKKIN